MLAYHVWLCTRSAAETPAVIARSVERIRNAAFAPASRGSSSECAVAPSRGAPMQCTPTSISPRSSRTRKSTWTPAPPYTSGGYSRVRIARLMPANLVLLRESVVSIHDARAQHHPDRRRGKPVDAPHQGPRETRRAVRWLLPADRLRAVQHRQRRLPQHRRPHAVQVALARPAHLPDLAALVPAGQLRRLGAGAAAAGPELVPR